MPLKEEIQTVEKIEQEEFDVEFDGNFELNFGPKNMCGLLVKKNLFPLARPSVRECVPSIYEECKYFKAMTGLYSDEYMSRLCRCISLDQARCMGKCIWGRHKFFQVNMCVSAGKVNTNLDWRVRVEPKSHEMMIAESIYKQVGSYVEWKGLQRRNVCFYRCQ